MGILLGLRRQGTVGIRIEHTGDDSDPMADAGQLGLEAAALGGSESLVGQLERREGVQGLSHARESLGEPDRQRPERGRRAVDRAHDRDRVLEQPPPLAVVLGDFEGGHQSQALRGPEPVALGGFGDRILILGLEPTKCLGQGDPDPSLGDETLDLGRELFAEPEAAFHPATLPSAQPGDGGVRQPVLVAERRHHASLVDRRQCPARSIGQQHRHLLLGKGRGPLDDHRHTGEPVRQGPIEALEAVDHLEPSVLPRRDPQGQLRKRRHRRSEWGRTSPEGPECRPELVHRQGPDAATGRCGAGGLGERGRSGAGAGGGGKDVHGRNPCSGHLGVKELSDVSARRGRPGGAQSHDLAEALAGERSEGMEGDEVEALELSEGFPDFSLAEGQSVGDAVAAVKADPVPVRDQGQ